MFWAYIKRFELKWLFCAIIQSSERVLVTENRYVQRTTHSCRTFWGYGWTVYQYINDEDIA